MEAKDSCIFRANWLNAAKGISDKAQRCDFYEALMEYAMTGEKAETSPELSLALNIIYSLIDKDREKYDRIIEKRREAGRLGGYQKAANMANLANDSKCQQMVANVANLADTVTVTDTVTDTEKDKSFNNTPIPPMDGRVLGFEDFFQKVQAVKIPKAIEETHYERQYVWRVAEGMTDYAKEVDQAIRTKATPYLQDYIGAINKKYPTTTPFEQLLLAMSMARLKTSAQRKAVFDELKRSRTEPGIFRTLTEKVDYINNGGSVTSLTGFFKSRK